MHWNRAFDHKIRVRYTRQKRMVETKIAEYPSREYHQKFIQKIKWHWKYARITKWTSIAWRNRVRRKFQVIQRHSFDMQPQLSVVHMFCSSNGETCRDNWNRGTGKPNSSLWDQSLTWQIHSIEISIKFKSIRLKFFLPCTCRQTHVCFPSKRSLETWLSSLSIQDANRTKVTRRRRFCLRESACVKHGCK